MGIIQLNIRYPEYPFDWVAEQDPMQDAPEPRFPHKNGGVSVFGIWFDYCHVRIGGFNPYAGDQWTAKIGRLEIFLTTLVCYEFKVSWNLREKHRACEVEFKELPWAVRKLFKFLGYRLKWHNSHLRF